MAAAASGSCQQMLRLPRLAGGVLSEMHAFYKRNVLLQQCVCQRKKLAVLYGKAAA